MEEVMKELGETWEAWNSVNSEGNSEEPSVTELSSVEPISSAETLQTIPAIEDKTIKSGETKRKILNTIWYHLVQYGRFTDNNLIFKIWEKVYESEIC